MKVVMNCLPAASGGGIAIIRNLVPLLAEKFAATGHEISFLLHADQADLVPTLKRDSVMWVSERVGGWKRLVWEKRQFGAILSGSEVDVLFTPYQVAALLPGVKNVLMLTNMEPFLQRGFKYSLANRLRNTALQITSGLALRGADRVITISKFTAQYAEAVVGVPSQRICTIYHGRNDEMAPVDDAHSDIAALRSVGITEPFVLTCGSILPYRRCEDVIAAFEQSVDRLPPGTQLAIAGTGTDQRYRMLLDKLIEASPVRDRIVMLGHVSLRIMAALYRCCLVCVIASEIEACPNIAIEAMTAGCVIISSDKPPLPEMFAGSATVYRARDVYGLADAVVNSVASLELRAEMRSRALQRCKDFCWVRSAQETCAALTDWP